jgi:NAD(P)-dependent dehydrogenase (short-subunit alcohol dehydrogenase family)
MQERRTVLVTGANSGIGLATAIEVASRGFRSVGTVCSRAKAAAVARAAREAGVEVRIVLLDVTDPQGCRRVVDRVRPWGLVNNAGTSFTGAIEDVADEEARRALDTMVLAPMRLARLALPHMRAQGGGRIVNVSSIYGLTTTPLTGWYQGAKHALEALSDALRMEVAADGVSVVLVEPGGFRTGIWGEAEGDLTRHQGSRYEQAYRRTLQQIRLSQWILGHPSRVARTIGRALTARSPRARYLVGIDAQFAAIADAVTPTGVKDLLVRKTLGL